MTLCSCDLVSFCQRLKSELRLSRTVWDADRCPLLIVPMAIMYAAREAHGTGGMFHQITGCAVFLVAFVVSSRRLLPTIMQLLLLKDKEKVGLAGIRL